MTDGLPDEGVLVPLSWAPIMTDAQLAKALGLTRRRLKRKGWPCMKVGNDWVYVIEDVIVYLRKYGRAA